MHGNFASKGMLLSRIERVSDQGQKDKDSHNRLSRSQSRLTPAPQDGEELAERDAVEEASEQKLVLLKKKHLGRIITIIHQGLAGGSRHEENCGKEVLLREGVARGPGYVW